VRKLYEQSARTATWRASDPDGDEMTYDIDVQREGSTIWIPLAASIEDEFFSWDARQLPDGLYRLRLTASDSRDNARGRELAHSRTSAAFWVDNSRPDVVRREVARHAESYEVTFVARDSNGSVAAVEIAVDRDAWESIAPIDGVADSAEERYRFVVEPERSGEEDDGQRVLRIRVVDSAGNMGGDAWALD
jgi:hypothetical protein